MKILTKSSKQGRKINQIPTINITLTSINSPLRTGFFKKKEYIALVELEQGLAIAVSLVKKDGFSSVVITGGNKNQTAVARFNELNKDVLKQHHGKYIVGDIVNQDGLNCLLLKKKPL